MRKEPDDYREEKWWIATAAIIGACIMFWVAIINWLF